VVQSASAKLAPGEFLAWERDPKERHLYELYAGVFELPGD
jgi:hypothetical protein